MKTHRPSQQFDWRRFFGQFWKLLVGLVIGLCGLAYVAWGATYNFYFNNTEQGDNSTATPSVTVSDGKATKTPGTPEAQPSPGPSAAPVVTASPTPVEPPAPIGPAPAPATAENRSEARLSMLSQFWRELPLGQDEQRHFRLTAGGASFLSGGSIGPIVDAAIVFNKWVAINGFAASLDSDYRRQKATYGAELELTPLHIPLGEAHPRFIELGLVAGVNNIYPLPENYVTPHAGARLTLNFGNTIALTAVGRGNAGHQMIESGIVFKL
jgi:hypothetical protein